MLLLLQRTDLHVIVKYQHGDRLDNYVPFRNIFGLPSPEINNDGIRNSRGVAASNGVSARFAGAPQAPPASPEPTNVGRTGGDTEPGDLL